LRGGGGVVVSGGRGSLGVQLTQGRKRFAGRKKEWTNTLGKSVRGRRRPIWTGTIEGGEVLRGKPPRESSEKRKNRCEGGGNHDISRKQGTSRQQQQKKKEKKKKKEREKK